MTEPFWEDVFEMRYRGEQLTVSRECLRPSGDLSFSTIVANRLVRRRYSGYSQAEATRLFRDYIKTGEFNKE